MIQIKVIALGTKMPNWVQTATDEFKKRLSPYMTLKLIELDIPKRSKNNTIPKLKQIEADSIRSHLKSGELVVVLDEHGKQWTSEQFAKKLDTWHSENQTINFIIGGPDGIDNVLIQEAHQHWSLGKLVYPHALVRVILYEQLYRAVSILQQHPYHRGGGG